MIETAINIGYIVIVVLSVAITYYAIRIVEIRYNIFQIFDKFKKGKECEKITWNQR